MIVAASPGRYSALSNASFTVAAAASTRVATGADTIVPAEFFTVIATPPALTPVRVNTASPFEIVAAVPESETVATSDEYA